MENRIFNKVFLWMFVGLMITFITGYVVSMNPNMLYNIFSSGLQIYIYIAEILIVFYLTRRIFKMSGITARVLFCLYSFFTGLTFSVLFAYFEISSIIYVFGITALTFGIFAVIGATTKMDLSKIGNILVMGLFALLIISVINFIIKSSQLDMILSCLFLIIFMAITAYDIQKIRKLQESFQDENKIAIIGALELYLDFINIFLQLLRLFGKNKD